MSNHKNISDEIDEVSSDLANQGITTAPRADRTGMGDIIEDVLNKCGITEERFKEWFNLKECGCSKRKKWLNSVFSWHVWNKQHNKGE